FGNSQNWLPTVKYKKSGEGKDIFSTNMAEKSLDVYCTPGSSSGSVFNSEKGTIKLDHFREYSITDIKDNFEKKEDATKKYFRVSEEGEIEERESFEKRKFSIEVESGETIDIFLEGTGSTIGKGKYGKIDEEGKIDNYKNKLDKLRL